MKTTCTALLSILCLVSLTGCDKAWDDVTGPDDGSGSRPWFDLTLSEQAPQRNETITLDLNAHDLTGFRAANLDLRFGADELELLDVRCDASFLGEDGFSFLVPDETGARVGLGRIDGSVPSGSGVLAEFVFRCLRAGESSIDLHFGQILDEDGGPCVGTEALAPLRIGIKVGE